jgi:uncharacterized protein YbaP (TraB family)
MSEFRGGLGIAVGLSFGIACTTATSASTFLWKISSSHGQALYLGGSWHALRSSDYPLPETFSRALDASTKLALEVNPDEMRAADKGIMKAALYPKGDSLKHHVDPRTYDYIRRLFSLMNVPEEKIVRYRPWFIALMLQSPSNRGMSLNLGVEQFLTNRARSKSKQIVGLENAREHADVFLGLSDRESEAFLLLTFIPAQSGSLDFSRLMNAWRNGDAELPWRAIHDGFRDFPSLGERILDARNRNWIPKIEGYLRSSQTYFVVVGAAHMGGPEGLLALLRARGYKIEQL